MLPGNDIEYYPEDQHQVEHENGDPENRDADDGQPKADTIDDYDKLVRATFLLDPIRSLGNVATKAMVIKYKTDMHGKPLGNAHQNPLLDNQEYNLELEDGTFDSNFAHTIAKNLFS